MGFSITESTIGGIAVPLVSSAYFRNISVAKWDPRTISFIENKLNAKVGCFIVTCKNKIGSCVEVNAENKIIRQSVRPEDAKFADAYRPKRVYLDTNKELKTEHVVVPCDNCKIVWPDGVMK